MIVKLEQPGGGRIFQENYQKGRQTISNKQKVEPYARGCSSAHKRTLARR